MEREIDLKAVSDGRLYGANDMVKADCGDCEGCSACCRGMGTSIILDPLDIFRGIQSHVLSVQCPSVSQTAEGPMPHGSVL